MGSTAQLVWGMLFGAIGMGFFVYGKRQKAFAPLLVGMALCIFPYFMPNVYALVIVGAVLIVLPYFIRA